MASFQSNTKKTMSFTQKVEVKNDAQTLSKETSMRWGVAGLVIWGLAAAVASVDEYVSCPFHTCYAPEIFKVKAEQNKERMMEKF